MIACPECGYAAPPDDFDCIGACNDNLFCRYCHSELCTGTGRAHRCGKSAAGAAADREAGVSCPPAEGGAE